MRRLFYIVAFTMLFVSCHESLEERAERETKDFTKRNCPIQVSEGVINDSMTYEKATRTIHYYYSLSGRADTTSIDMKKARESLLQGIKNATSIKKYKEKDFNFAYTYCSTKHKGLVLIETVITPKDYK